MSCEHGREWSCAQCDQAPPPEPVDELTAEAQRLGLYDKPPEPVRNPDGEWAPAFRAWYASAFSEYNTVIAGPMEPEMVAKYKKAFRAGWRAALRLPDDVKGDK